MPLSAIAGRVVSIAAAVLISISLAACSTAGLQFVSTKTQGHDLSEDQLVQIREGQSQQLVQAVLGTPQMTNTFGSGEAWYYVENKVTETEFGLVTSSQRTVLAIYFDSNKRIADRAIYSNKDGRVFAIESHRTPSFGEDRTFIDSILKSF